MSETESTHANWGVIVLAGDRGPDDPVAQAGGARCKAMADVAGQPLLARVLDALSRSEAIADCCVVGPSADIVADNPELAALLEQRGVRWIAPEPSPVASALAGLSALGADRPALITTADHALLDTEMIAAMCRARPGVDLSVGLVDYALVRDAFPDSRRTAIRFGGEGYCGCNLFALHTPRGRRLVERWRRVETQRKHPARVVAGMLGWAALARYALRRLSLDGAFDRLSRRHDLNAVPVLLDDPRAAVDVDSIADLRQVEAILRAAR
ncbi:nucleotidyltransferase family protein [Salinisphaera sp. SPP-AMP-43]|uniref:nucleotidyltransferase family protein n=1 Tax=Salinisphaera sp. SPP-AMP-43 TaxID=3121288 RepID=UPI003C6E6D21